MLTDNLRHFRSFNIVIIVTIIVTKVVKVAYRIHIWQKFFFQNSEKFGNSFIKNGIIYMNLTFIYSNPITISRLKNVTLKF